MKTWLRFAVIMVLGLGAIVISEKHQVDVPASPNAILYLAADTEQELARMPVSFTRMSDEEEIRIGNDLARANRPLSSNEATQRDANRERVQIENYLAEVGSRIEVHAHRKLPYRFHYVPEANFINAFALPGGHVYLGAGLLRLMDSEDELASVMGHEIEHIDHYHCAERVQQEMALRKIPFGGLIELPIEIFEAGYSKNQELEADREGVRLTVASGYSPGGAVRLFEKFDRLYKQRYHKARSPEEELSQVAEQTLEGYFRSHPLPSERIQQVEKLTATENWSIRPERDLKVAYIFLSERAADELAGHRYAEAEKLALRSLAMHSGTLQALKVLATSQFAQAKFRAAADSYRLASEADPADGDLVNSYAHALSATGDRQRVLDEFREWLPTREKNPSYTLTIALAGLELMAGNQARAQQLVAAAQASPDKVPSNSLSDLGWWYYLAGQYPKAIDVLAKAVQLRPGERTIAERLAWAEIETSRYGDALQVLSAVNALASASQYGTRTHDSDMVWAVAQWRGMRDDATIRRFAAVVESQPEWNNNDWVKANYSPGVLRTVEELRALLDKRPKKFLAEPS